MGAITGIELGPDSCVLVCARRRDTAIELSAAHHIQASTWPAQDALAAELLRHVRRAQGFPRTARVVVWGIAEASGPRDAATRAALSPLVAAGFRIDSVISPPQALALVAAIRPRAGASAWVSINRHGAAISIVRGTELLFSRAFGWNWERAAIGSQAQLLHRYLTVSHLAPEIRRAAEIVRTKFGVAVESAVTCGDLPDLRSLTMPLIEELDFEVETLDSAEGLYLPTWARRDRLPDSLAAVRLACAAVASRDIQWLDVDFVRVVRAAALVAAVGGVAWAGYVWLVRPQPPEVSARPSTPAENRADAASTAPPSAARSESGPLPTSTSGAASGPAIVSSPPPISNARNRDSFSVAPEPARSVAPNPTSPRSNRPSSRVESQTAGVLVPGADAPSAPRTPASTDIQRSRPRSQPQPTSSPSTATLSPPSAGPPAPDTLAPAPRFTRPAPLKHPVPQVDTILVSSDRRLAVIEGAVLSVGDAVGPRTVARIEVDAVFLREPSGLEIRVPIRARRGR